MGNHFLGMEKKNDQQFIQFLQWALPRLGLRWPGFRKVRGQVRKRVSRRIAGLNLSGLDDYRQFLAEHQEEWSYLNRLCRITISRFFRDRGVFESLCKTVLPDLASQVASSDRNLIRCWSCGCASGEEPYTLALIWHLSVAPGYPEQGIAILGTDADPVMLKRAEEADYPTGNLKELPAKWREEAFQPGPPGHLSLKAEYKKIVRFMKQDIRETAPVDRFHLILCRNLVFTYFDRETQRKILGTFYDHLEIGGALVIGCHEKLPLSAETSLTPWIAGKNIFRKSDPLMFS